MAEERGKPFVGWMGPLAGPSPNNEPGFDYVHYQVNGRFQFPCVVTPLLPDDPRPGETWLHYGIEVEILGPPQVDGRVHVRQTGNGSPAYVLLSGLRRPPVLKTFRLKYDDGAFSTIHTSIRAESREQAIAKLSEALEEVD